MYSTGRLLHLPSSKVNNYALTYSVDVPEDIQKLHKVVDCIGRGVCFTGPLKEGVAKPDATFAAPMTLFAQETSTAALFVYDGMGRRGHTQKNDRTSRLPHNHLKLTEHEINTAFFKATFAQKGCASLLSYGRLTEIAHT